MIPVLKKERVWDCVVKIGFVGNQGSGKTTCANYLVGQISNSEKISFADGIRKDIISMKLTPDGRIDKARDRKVLQLYGGFRRGEIKEILLNGVQLANDKFKCYSNYWIDVTQDAVAEAEFFEKNIFVDDIRRIDEAQMLKKEGFIVVKVYTPDVMRIERLILRDSAYDPSTAQDVSETEVDLIPYDIFIDNGGLMEYTQTQLDGLLTMR